MFGFYSFFPTFMQPPIEICSKFVYNLLVGIKVCRKPVRKYDVGAPTAITISLPGTDTHDAERRRYTYFFYQPFARILLIYCCVLFRQIALKALSERLSQQADSGSSWPSLDDDSRPKTEVQAGDQSSPASNPVEPLTVAVEIDPSTSKPSIA
jgi:hypothetical protein